MAFDKRKQLELFDRYQADRSIQLRNQIAIANEGLVQKVAHQFVKQSKNVDYDDLFQVGFIALVRSIERYNPQISSSFASYAVPNIKGDILHYLRDKHDTVRPGRDISDSAVASRKVIEKLILELGRDPTNLEIANGLGVSLDRWLKIEQGFYECNSKSLNSKVSTLGNETTEILDLTIDKSQVDRSELNELLADVHSSIEQLPRNTRNAIDHYYIQNFNKKDSARRLGVSPMTITRRLAVGVLQLKALLA